MNPTPTIAATSSQALWYLTRASGIVALLLLTGTVVLGIVTAGRFRSANWPGFALQALHRRLAGIAIAFVGLHVLTTLMDRYVSIRWIAAVVPFTSSYRTFWVGIGTVALDLWIAVAISSVLRRWINPRHWRALHWLAYGSWPIALAHALGMGTDARLSWVQGLVGISVASVVLALGWRLHRRWSDRPPRQDPLAARRTRGDVLGANR